MAIELDTGGEEAEDKIDSEKRRGVEKEVDL